MLNALEAAEARHVAGLGLVNVLGSTLTHHSRAYLPLACGYEISVPATKTFINQVVAFLYLALRMAGQSVDMLTKLPELIDRTIDETDPQVERLLDVFADRGDMYELGYGLTYGIALEGAGAICSVVADLWALHDITKSQTEQHRAAEAPENHNNKTSR